MQILLTDKQKAENNRPTRLEVLSEFNKRGGLNNNEELKSEFLRLERGFEGEQILLDYIEAYGEDDWVVLRNVWLDFFGGFECDVLLITRAGLYPFEVKNFSGTFVLKDNIGMINGLKIGKHPISQGQNMNISLNAIFKNQPSTPNILSTVIFIGENSQINVHDSVPDLNILTRNELKDFIWKIAQAEKYYQGKDIDVDAILRILAEHEIVNPFPAVNLTSELKDDILPGIMCCYCRNFDLEIGRKSVVCDCGMHESRDEAIVRTICEYGVMHFDRHLKTTEIVEFFDGLISRSNVHCILKDYFNKDGSYRDAQIMNIGLPFYRMYDNFEFVTSKFKIISGPIQVNNRKCI